jgi:hypothetical protein
MAGVTRTGAMPVGVGCGQWRGVRVLACRCRWRDAERGPGWTPCKSRGCRIFRGLSTRCLPIGGAGWKPGTLVTMRCWANRAAMSSGGSAGWSRRTRRSGEPRGARRIAGQLRIVTGGVCCSRDTQVTTGSRSGRREARHSRLVVEAVPASRRAGSALPGRARVGKVERPTGTTFPTRARSGCLRCAMGCGAGPGIPESPGSRGGAPAAGGRVLPLGPEALPAGGMLACGSLSRASVSCSLNRPPGMTRRQRYGITVVVCPGRGRVVRRRSGWMPCASPGCRIFRTLRMRSGPTGSASWKPGTGAPTQPWANRAARASGGSGGGLHWPIQRSRKLRRVRTATRQTGTEIPSACCSRDTRATTRMRRRLQDRRVCLPQALVFHKPHVVAAMAAQGLAAVALTSVGEDATRRDRRRAQAQQRTKAGAGAHRPPGAALPGASMAVQERCHQ